MINNFFSTSLYSGMRIALKTVHHIMEDNFALCYVFKRPGVNSLAELVPSPRAYARNGASRRWLGNEVETKDSCTVRYS